jgi:hypothetical protein
MNMRLINNLAVKKVIMLLSFVAIPSFTVLSSEYDRWETHNPEETSVINHTPMSQVLKFLTVEDGNNTKMAYYLTKGGALDYIVNYRKYLEKIPVSLLNKNEQLAYWLNLHNIAVIEMISTDNRLAKKLKKLRGQPGNPGKEWAKKRLTVENQQLSLEEIEQQILLRYWQDPLVLYGIFYSTKGSPNLGIEAFQGSTVFTQLAGIASKFIANKNNVKISNDEVKVSSLYAWNKDRLFAGDDKLLIEHLQKYAQGRSADKLKDVVQVDDSHKFSWSTIAERRPRQSSGFVGSGAGSYVGGGS